MNLTCITCSKSKPTLECGHCKEALCKNCAHFLEEDEFAFLSTIPKDLSHSVYCHSCFEGQVATELANYNDTMEKAKELSVFFKKQGKETRLIRRIEDPISVATCDDYNECLLRLAFMAVQSGHNAIIDVEIVSQKVRNGSYQLTRWSGTAVPAQVRDSQLVKDRSIWQNPN